MAKPPKSSAVLATAVRTRRAYFDCRFGQLHVRTAFPTTGGFDEGTTLFCLHPEDGSGRVFDKFLPDIANERSVYAPDLPGCGESDAAPSSGIIDAADAVQDLAHDLRLRQIDVLGFRSGAAVAIRLAASKPDLVRRLVLVAPPSMDTLPVIEQESLVMCITPGRGDELRWPPGPSSRAKFVRLTDCTADIFDAAPESLCRQIGAFLNAESRADSVS